MFNGCFTGAVSGCEFSISEIHGRRPGSLCAETGSHTSPASFASLTAVRPLEPMLPIEGPDTRVWWRKLRAKIVSAL